MYPFASVYEKERTLYIFHHNYITHDQWRDNFNTWPDVSNSIGVTRKHKVLLEHVAQENTVIILKASQKKKKDDDNENSKSRKLIKVSI